MNSTKKESLGSEIEGDERMLDGEIAKFVRKLNKYKYKSKEYAKNWQFSMGRSSGKDEKKDKSIIKEFTIECFKDKEKGRDISPPDVLCIKKKVRKSCKSHGVNQNHVNQMKINPMEERNALISQPLWQVSIKNHS